MEWIAGVIVLVSLGAVMWALAMFARRVRRHGTAGQALAAAMASYDEGFHSTAHDTFVEMKTQDERGQQASVAGGRGRRPGGSRAGERLT
jgi:hypothetical protein